MNQLTLIIPAKSEKISLPIVLEELKLYDLKKIIILDKNDSQIINSIKKFKCKIIIQKKNGYGAAIIEGINVANSKYICIFNADGSFDPKYLKPMFDKVKKKFSFIFASRYMSGGGSFDDTLLTLVGNKIFTLIGKIFFKLKLTDILFTFILGEKKKFQNLNLKSFDFRLCVEIPIKIQKRGFSYSSIACIERSRFADKKKVNELKDGFFILMYMIREFIKKNAF